MSDKIEDNQDELTLKDFFNKIQELFKYIKIHWIKIVLLGIIGGVLFIWYVLFACIGKSYNAFNVRARLAQ